MVTQTVPHAPAMNCKKQRRVAVIGALALAALCFATALIASTTDLSALLASNASASSWGLSLFCVLLVGHGIMLLFVAGRLAGTPCPTESAARLDSDRYSTAGSWMLLALICVVALVLRLIHLDSGLWHDEILALVNYGSQSWNVILTDLPDQNNHIFYTLLARGSFQVFGESVWAFRLPAVLFGVGGIVALFLLGRNIVGNKESLLACALLAVSYHHIWFSQNARGYTGVLMFTLLTTWLWIRGLPRNEWRWWIGYAICGAIGMWTHMTMAFVLAVQGTVFSVLSARNLLRGPGRLLPKCEALGSYGKPLVGFLLCASLTLQLYALALPSFVTQGLHEVSLRSDWTNPLWLLVETGRALLAGFSSATMVMAGLVLGVGSLIVAIGYASYVRLHWPLAVVMVLPAVLIFALMYAMGHNLWPRFAFFAAGFALLTVVRGAMQFANFMLRVIRPRTADNGVAPLLGTGLVLLLIAASLATLPRYYSLPKQDYLGAMVYVKERSKADEVVASAGLAAMAYCDYYAPTWKNIDDAKQLAQLCQEHSGVWLVVSLPIHLEEWHPDILQAIQNDFELVKVFPGTLRGGEVYVYRNRRPNSVAAARQTGQ